MNFPPIAPRGGMPVEPTNPSSSDVHDGSSNPGAGSTGLKRIPYACTACKKAKTKCSGPPEPCARCHKFNGECIFDESTDRRRRVSVKRTAEDLRQHQELLNQLLLVIGAAGDAELSHLREMVRTGTSKNDISFFVQRKLRSLGFGMGDTSFPQAAAQLGLKRRKSGSESIPSDEETKHGSFPTNKTETSTGRRASDVMSMSNLCDIPLFRVPVDQWCDLVDQDDNDLVSQLVSLFFAWLNPVWRIIEQDVFLEAMRESKKSRPLYCSTFLVHAIFAVSSHLSTHSSIFSDKKNPMSRGLRFHQEAKRLWDEEKHTVSLVNVQALCILGLDSILRGDHEYAYQLFDEVQWMYKKIGLDTEPRRPLDARVQGNEEKYLQIWRSLSWTVFNISSYYALITMTRPMLEIPNIQRPYHGESLHAIMTWLEYPGNHDARELKLNEIFSATCDLMEKCYSFSAAMFSDAAKVGDVEWRIAERALLEIHIWEESLPPGAVVDELSAPAVYELHFVKILAKARMTTLLFPSSANPDTQNSQSLALYNYSSFQTPNPMIRVIHEASQMMRAFRIGFTFEHTVLHMVLTSYYGCVLLAPFLMYPSCAADFTCLFQVLFASGHRFIFARVLSHRALLAAKNANKHVPQQVVDMINSGIKDEPASPSDSSTTTEAGRSQTHTSIDDIITSPTTSSSSQQNFPRLSERQLRASDFTMTEEQKAMSRSWLPDDIGDIRSFYPNYDVERKSKSKSKNESKSTKDRSQPHPQYHQSERNSRHQHPSTTSLNNSPMNTDDDEVDGYDSTSDTYAEDIGLNELIRKWDGMGLDTDSRR